MVRLGFPLSVSQRNIARVLSTYLGVDRRYGAQYTLNKLLPFLPSLLYSEVLYLYPLFLHSHGFVLVTKKHDDTIRARGL